MLTVMHQREKRNPTIDLIDNEVFRRFHRDLLLKPSVDTSELDQLTRYVSIQHRSESEATGVLVVLVINCDKPTFPKTPDLIDWYSVFVRHRRASGIPASRHLNVEAFGPDTSLDDVIRSLKNQRKHLDAWKQQKNLIPLEKQPPDKEYVTAPVFESAESHAKENRSPDKVDDDKEAAEHEIQRLRQLVRRYQEADPVADFVHKDILARVQDELAAVRQDKESILDERNRLMRKLESAQWENARIVSDREEAVAEVEKAKKELVNLNDLVLEKDQESEKHRQAALVVERQLRELQRRYETIDNHLMELGEQKTAFLEGIRERQSQLDFSIAQLQTTQEDLVKSEREREFLLEETKRYKAEIKTCQEEIERLSKELSEKIETLDITIKKLSNVEAQNNSLTEKLAEAEEHSTMQQQLLAKLNSALASTTDKFDQFVKEVEGKEVSWSAVTQKAWEELQRLKKNMQTQISLTGVVPSMESPRSDLPREYEDLVATTKTREADLKRAIADARAQIDTLKADNAQKQKEVAKLGDANKANAERIAELKRKIQELEKEVEGLKKRLANVERERDMLVTDKKKLEEDVLALKKGLKQKEEDISRLTSDLKQQKRQRHVAEAGRKAAENRVADRRKSVGWADTTTKPEMEIKKLIIGVPVVKLSYKHQLAPFVGKHKPKEYFIQLSEDGSVLKLWKGTAPSTKPPNKTISLASVIRTEFGPTSTASVWAGESRSTKKPPMVPGSLPWRCFSVYTSERSYDLVCKDDRTTEALVLGVGNAKLPANVIAVRSRRELLYRRVKLKLEAHCKRRGITMKQLLLEAIRRCVATTPGLAVELAAAKGTLKAKGKGNLEKRFSLEAKKAASSALHTLRDADGRLNESISPKQKKTTSLERQPDVNHPSATASTTGSKSTQVKSKTAEKRMGTPPPSSSPKRIAVKKDISNLKKDPSAIKSATKLPPSSSIRSSQSPRESMHAPGTPAGSTTIEKALGEKPLKKPALAPGTRRAVVKVKEQEPEKGKGYGKKVNVAAKKRGTSKR